MINPFAKIKALEAELEDKKTELASQQSTFQKKVNTLEGQLEAAQMYAADLECDLSFYEARSSALARNLETADTAIDEFMSEREVLKFTVDCYKDTLDEAEEAYGKLKADFEALEEILTDVEGELEETETELEAFKNNLMLERQYIRTALSEFMVTIKNLKEENEDLRSIKAFLENRNEELHEHIEGINETRDAHVKQLNKCNVKIRMQRGAINTLQRKVERTEQNVRDINSAATEVIREADQMLADLVEALELRGICVDLENRTIRINREEDCTVPQEETNEPPYMGEMAAAPSKEDTIVMLLDQIAQNTARAFVSGPPGPTGPMGPAYEPVEDYYPEYEPEGEYYDMNVPADFPELYGDDPTFADRIADLKRDGLI